MASYCLFLSKAVLLCQCPCKRLLLRSFSSSVTLTFTICNCSPLLCCIKQSTFLTFQALQVLLQYQVVIFLLQVVFEANFHHTHVKFWTAYIQALNDTSTYLFISYNLPQKSVLLPFKPLLNLLWCGAHRSGDCWAFGVLRSEAKHTHKCCLIVFLYSSHLSLSICFVI